MPSSVRTRFAPSPTGHLHVGGARTALFNWLFARHEGGTFILRVEDTDLVRSTEDSAREIVSALRWLGLDWDEGPEVGGPHAPYFQSERLKSYNDVAELLMKRGLAYVSHEEAKGEERGKRKEGHTGETEPVSEAAATPSAPAIRFNSRAFAEDVTFTDLFRGTITFKNEDLEDFVILKSHEINGLRVPTYNYGVVVDDIAMGVSHVLRGDDHLSNTPRQIMLYKALGADLPVFGHLPMILGPDKQKLSKRHGANSVEQFRDLGILREALVNYLALLGWSFDGSREFFTVQELVEYFSLARVGSTPAVFDTAKLEWMNAEYLKNLPLEEKTSRARPFLQQAGFLSPTPVAEEEALALRLVSAMGDRLKKLPEAVEYSRFLFVELPEYDRVALEKNVFKGNARSLSLKLVPILEALEEYTPEALEPVLHHFAEERGLGLGKVFQPLRVALTGSAVSFGIFDILALLGKPRTLQRVRHVLSLEAPQ